MRGHGSRRGAWGRLVGVVSAILAVTCLVVLLLGPRDVTDASQEADLAQGGPVTSQAVTDGQTATGALASPDPASSPSVTRWSTEGGVAEASGELLEGYRSAGEPVVLARSGYLDLLGNVWSCVVQGAGWVDVCVVSSASAGGAEVRVMRLEEARWEELYANR